MANFEQVQKNLEARRYKVKVFASAAEAADYLDVPRSTAPPWASAAPGP